VAVNYNVQVESAEVCGEIETLKLSRPAEFDFEAGQWLRLTLDTADGEATRTFTIASAPADEWLEITTRLSGSVFKNALAALRPRDPVSLAGPGGRLHLPQDADSMVFLAGGVGITPVRSMLRDAVGRGRVFADALVIYGNRDPSCVAYARELEAMAPMGVRLVNVYEEAPESWSGARGFITQQAVRAVVDVDDGRPFFVTGPPVMVEAMQRVLDELAVDRSRRTVESFSSVPPTRAKGK